MRHGQNYCEIDVTEYKKIASCSPTARTVWIELQIIASNKNYGRYGFIQAMEGGIIPEATLAKMCNLPIEEFQRGFIELRSVGIPAKNGEGLYYFPHMVEREAKLQKVRIKVKKHRRKWLRNRYVTVTKPRENKEAPPREKESPPRPPKEKEVPPQETKEIGGASPQSLQGQKPYPQRADLAPAAKVICAWKEMEGFPYDDRDWDEAFWPRHAKAVKVILKFLKNDYKMAIQCCQDVREGLLKDGLPYSIETVIKRMAGWKVKNEHKYASDPKAS